MNSCWQYMGKSKMLRSMGEKNPQMCSSKAPDLPCPCFPFIKLLLTCHIVWCQTHQAVQEKMWWRKYNLKWLQSDFPSEIFQISHSIFLFLPTHFPYSPLLWIVNKISVSFGKINIYRIPSPWKVTSDLVGLAMKYSVISSYKTIMTTLFSSN